MNLTQLIADRRILLTMGPGGVGKTTVAAALGLEAAVRGRRALVLTLDPALRLADALGLKGIPAGEMHEISAEQLQRAGVPAKRGLCVSMLDTRRAWAETIEREVTDRKQRERILRHPFFDRMSRDLAGAREYAAMEELYHLYLRGGFDLVILDTPPTVHGVDFLEAPDRVLDVLEHNSYRWLMRPALLAGKVGLRVLNFSGGYVVRTLSRFTGMDFLKELAGFVDLFSGLLEGFRQRAAAVKATLRSPVTAFVLVTTADERPADEAVLLYKRLRNRDFAPEAVIVNRMTPRPPALPNEEIETSWRRRLTEAGRATGGADEAIAKALSGMEQAHQTLTAMASREGAQLDRLTTGLKGTCSLNPISLLDSDIHNLQSLERLRQSIFASDAKGES